MSRLTNLAALLHLHAAQAEANPHPINLAQSVANVFRTLGDELKAMESHLEDTIDHVAAMSTEEIERIMAGFRAGAAGAFDGAAPVPAGAPVLSTQPAPASAEETTRAQFLAVAFFEGYGCQPIPWDSLTPNEQAGWLAAARVQ